MQSEIIHMIVVTYGKWTLKIYVHTWPGVSTKFFKEELNRKKFSDMILVYMSDFGRTFDLDVNFHGIILKLTNKRILWYDDETKNIELTFKQSLS